MFLSYCKLRYRVAVAVSKLKRYLDTVLKILLCSVIDLLDFCFLIPSLCKLSRLRLDAVLHSASQISTHSSIK